MTCWYNHGHYSSLQIMHVLSLACQLASQLLLTPFLAVGPCGLELRDIFVFHWEIFLPPSQMGSSFSCIDHEPSFYFSTDHFSLYPFQEEILHLPDILPCFCLLLISLALLKLFGLGGPRLRRIARDVVAEISTSESNFGLCDRALCTLRLKESLLFLSFPPQYLIQYWVTQMLRRDLLS